MKYYFIFCFLLLGVVIGFFIGVISAENYCNRAWSNLLIEKGYAEYVLLDAKTGRTAFLWKKSE